MEQSGASQQSKGCLLKDCKLFYHSEKAMDLGHVSKSRSRRLTARRRSNSMSMCILPSIPEYPGFQDIKRNCSRGPNFGRQDLGRKRSENHLRLVDQNRNQGCSTDRCTNRQCKAKNFCDKSLQEYYNEKLTELRNYETKKANGKAKNYVDENQSQNAFSQSLQRRRSCSALIQARCLPLAEEASEPAEQVNKSVAMRGDHQGTDHNRCKRAYLDSLAMSINAPLQMLVPLK